MVRQWLCLLIILPQCVTPGLAIIRDVDKISRRANRIRRIIHGEDLRDRDSGYLVTNYFVWISNRHICGVFESFTNFFSFILGRNRAFYERGYYECDADPQKVMCGGALVTPTIVQTACHCVASQVGSEDENGVVRYLVDDAFTNMVLAYRGATSTDDMHTGYVSQMFLIHEKCLMKYNRLVYDYGLIALKAAVAPDAKFASNPTNFAPVYSENSIYRIWKNMNAKQTVCLFVGFGRFVDKKNDATKPSVMQHTWHVNLNPERCYLMTIPKNYANNFTTDATWSCFMPLPSKKSRTEHGDSGSPVTCDNEFVGLASAVWPRAIIQGSDKFPSRFRIIRTDFTTVSPIVYSIFVNGAEYRISLTKEIKKQIAEGENVRRLVPNIDPSLGKLHKSTPLRYLDLASSRSSALSIIPLVVPTILLVKPQIMEE